MVYEFPKSFNTRIITKTGQRRVVSGDRGDGRGVLRFRDTHRLSDQYAGLRPGRLSLRGFHQGRRANERIDGHHRLDPDPVDLEHQQLGRGLEVFLFHRRTELGDVDLTVLADQSAVRSDNNL